MQRLDTFITFNVHRLDIEIYDWLYIVGSDFNNNTTGCISGSHNTRCMSDYTMRFVRLNRE